jgi:hypothetical protein
MSRQEPFLVATEQEIGFPIEDFMGVDRQVDRENIDNYHQWTTQNLWEKKINILETRGGSALLASSWPSNITGVDNVVRIYKNTLDHKRVVALQGQENGGSTISPGISLPAGVSLSFSNGGGNWNAFIGGNADIYHQPLEIILRFFGYGYDNYTIITASAITGFSSGTAQTLNVVVSGTVINSNVTGIEVYAVVNSGTNPANNTQGTLWCGSIDLIAHPTGTFGFYGAPIAKRSVATGVSNGTIAAQYTAQGTTVNGGTLVPGKTYYVAVLPQYLVCSGTPASAQCSYRQFEISPSNILAVTLQQGENSIQVAYPSSSQSPAPPTFNTMLIAVGEDPQLLIPCGLSNVNANSVGGTVIFTIGAGTNALNQCASFPQNTPALVDIEQLSSSTLNLRFRQSDFSTQDCLCRIDNSGNKIPVFIARNSSVNRYDNGAISGTGLTLSGISVTSSAGNILIAAGSSGGLIDPIPIGTPVSFSFIAGGSVPGNIVQNQTYYLLPVSANTYNVSNTVNGTPIAYSSAGVTVTMSYTSFDVYPSVIGAQPTLYTGGFALSQPLLAQNYSFQQYQNVAYFVSGPSNNAAAIGPGGFPNAPVSGTNYYITDGNIAGLVVFDWSDNPTPVPYGNIISLYQQSIVVTSNDPQSQFSGYADAVWFTRATNPNNFEQPGNPGVNQFFAVEGGGEPINGFGIFPYQFVYVSPQQFFALVKKNSTWVLENLPTTFTSQTFTTQISKSVGTPQGRTIAYTPIGIIFAAVDNVYLIKGGTEPVPVGDPISFILKGADLSKATAAYHDEQYKLSFYHSDWSGTTGYNNVEFWLDIKKMKQSQGKPDWKGPMVGRQIDYDEVENLTGDGTVYNLTRDRICVDRQNVRVFKTDIIPAPTDTQVLDFATPVTTILETKDYRVQEQDNNWNKIFTRTYYKTRCNASSGSPLSVTENTYVGGQLVDTQSVSMSGLAATNFDDQPQIVYPVFPSSAPTLPYVGRTIRKVLTTNSRIAYGGIELFYRVIKRRI